jgi:uncharacterized membrane protein (DUF373 family)
MTRYQRFVRGFELVTVTALEVLLMLTVAAATLILIAILLNGLSTRVLQIASLEALQPELEDTFSGVLMVLLGLELLETLKTYFSEHHVRIEVILVVAMIAVGRHLIQIKFESVPALTLIGLGVLIVALSVGYFLVVRAHLQKGLNGTAE